MKTCKCFCSIIPPIMVDNLKKNGVEFASKTTAMNRSFRFRRTMKLKNLNLLAAVIPGNADRFVYDCKHTTHQRMAMLMREGSSPVADVTANEAYINAGAVRKFYKEVLNWNSMDDQGMDMIMNVHYSNKYNNAFWDGDEMTFGDGDGQIFTDFAKSLDVTGHEMTHGVVQFTAGLNYSGQSGALNEHYADAMGSAIKQYANNQTAATADWLIGNDIMGPSLKGQAIRSMKAPGTAYNSPLLGKDPQPDNMSKYYTGSADNYGVHINSGIPNKVFYLVSLGIETKNAAILWFATLKKMKPSTNFKGFKTKITQTTASMVKKGTLPANASTVVADAFAAVGL
jgi:Zn-dependent metalloprotease